jgi:outer membrane immunogenic protein
VHAHPSEELKMKKIVLALTAIAALTGSASAADMGRPYVKAPVVAAAPSWTGFYLFGGIGGGIWDANNGVQNNVTGNCIICTNTKLGGDGWFGTVGAGYDWQATPSWVFGVFADGTFGSLKGSIQDTGLGIVGSEKMRDAWAVGARLGYLVAPNVLSYVNAGYTQTYWSGSTLLGNVSGLPSGLHTNGFNRGGGFVGGGVENNLNIFGITAPGWFMKTEYRAAYIDSKNVTERIDGTNLPTIRDINFKPLVQTISTSLVYRFNWGGPVVAKY